MKALFPVVLACLSFFAFPCVASAASLQISPVTIEIPAPGAAGIVSLRNESAQPLTAQIRVFRWTQVNGEEKLEPSNDVVASPPLVTMPPRQNYSVRVVRTSRQPVGPQESYRLFIDELPDPSRQKAGAVNLVLRYSVPVFFTSPDTSAPKIEWAVLRRGGRVLLSATNTGERHLRLAAVKLRDAGGSAVSFGNGLLGYALPHSTMVWTAAGRTSGFALGSSATIAAQSDLGPINAAAAVRN